MIPAILLSIFGNVAQQVIPPLIDQVVKQVVKDNPTSAPAVLASKVTEAIVNDPVLHNQLSLEPPAQSGVTLGSLGALLAAIGSELVLVYAGNLDPALHTPNVIVIVGTLYALYRRWGRPTKAVGS
jgi:hypothetical protein